MNRIIKVNFLAVMLINSAVFALEDENRESGHSVRDIIVDIAETQETEVSIVNKFKKMFKKGKLSGNIRSIYSSYENKNTPDTYATAVGGRLKYELAEFNGFNAGAALRTTHDVNFAGGKGDKRNQDLSGSKGYDTQLSEAYINYEHKGLYIRAGRQIVDTPLADSDDIRMTPNTFEAYVAGYEFNGLSFMAAHLNSWQGYDAGLDNGWLKMGKNGVNFGTVNYSNKTFDIGVWYYNISNPSNEDIASGADENGNNSLYADISAHIDLSGNIFLHWSLQYLKQNEIEGSNVKADIYGTMAQVVVDDLSLSLAYDKSKKQQSKHSFSGFGGGTLYTSMDTMILDEITEDRSAKALVASLEYSVFDVNLLYAYGDFAGNANSLGVKEHITAQNIGVEYTTKNALTLSAIYVRHKNKEDSTSTFYNDNNFRILASYNF